MLHPLEKEVTNQPRKMVTLVWNTEDVMDVYASQFRPGEEHKFMEFPRDVSGLVA